MRRGLNIIGYLIGAALFIPMFIYALPEIDKLLPAFTVSIPRGNYSEPAESVEYRRAELQAQRIREADGSPEDFNNLEYLSKFVDNLGKCGYTIIETGDLIMSIGEEVEKEAPDVDYPRLWLMLAVKTAKPDDTPCFTYLEDWRSWNNEG